MSTIPLPPSSPQPPPPVPVRKFTADEDHRLGELGALTGEDRVELPVALAPVPVVDLLP